MNARNYVEITGRTNDSGEEYVFSVRAESGIPGLTNRLDLLAREQCAELVRQGVQVRKVRLRFDVEV